MPSPFPGMNPYLEQEGDWQGFHLLLLARIHEALVPQVRPKYFVTTEQLLFIHEEPAERRRLAGRADVAVVDERAASTEGRTTVTGAATQAPAYAVQPVAVDIEKHRYLEIRDRHTRDVVTVVEVLSPSNKRPGGDRNQYLAKRHQLLSAGVNLVEIDLLRGYGRLPLDGLPPCDYCAVVSRPQDWPRAGVWPVGLREPLPTVPVPLRPLDEDARLDLQSLLHAVHDAGGYADYRPTAQ